MEKTDKTAKKIGWAGIALCGLCCALPIVGAIAGISTLTAISFYLEKIGILALGLAGTFFIYSFYRKKQAAKACATTSCEVNCDCKEENAIKF